MSSGTSDWSCDHSNEYSWFGSPSHSTTTVASFDHSPTSWLGLDSVGFVGAVVSILKGPRWIGELQFPALSRVRKWNHQLPSVNGGLVAESIASSAGLVVAGSLLA